MGLRLNEVDILPYEGLVFRTTSMIVGFVDDDFEDIQQQLRLKVATALVAFESSRSKMTRNAFVFSCLVNLKKDILRRRRRGELMIEDIAGDVSEQSPAQRDRFESRYLVTTPEEVYGRIEDDDLVLPSTLTEDERVIVGLLYAGRMQIEAAAALVMTKGEMERAMRSIRVKLADHRPLPSESPSQSVADTTRLVQLPERDQPPAPPGPLVLAA